RIPRWAAVIVVYSLTLGGIYASIALTAPRLATEMAGLVRDLPEIVKKVQEEQLPNLRGLIENIVPGPDSEADAELVPPEVGPPPPPTPHAAVRIIPHDDGTYEVELGPGIEIHQS